MLGTQYYDIELNKESFTKEIMAARAAQYGKRIPKEFLEEEDDDE